MDNYAKHYDVPDDVGVYTPLKWECIFSILMLDSFKDDPLCTYVGDETIANIREMLSLMKIYPIQSLQKLLDTLDSPRFQYSKKYFHFKEDEDLHQPTNFEPIYSLIAEKYKFCKTPSSHIIMILLPNALIENSLVVPPMQEAAKKINRYFKEANQKSGIAVASEDLVKPVI